MLKRRQLWFGFVYVVKSPIVNNKAFLPDSYTSFKNKIGLTTDDRYLSENRDVVLSWPYKDCVLEGGQTKEDARRDEIFWNEILAPDEIDRLLAPKVLTNFQRYDQNGVGRIVNPTNFDQENLIIKGNNLLALHSLKKRFAGKVKLIYIDPPYNTGNDGFGYNDRFNHSSWLTFMKNRLEIARAVLRDDGSIWINIDDSEAHYLKVLCDEVFGQNNFVATVIWRKNYSPKSTAKYFSEDHDYLLVYAKTKDRWKLNLMPRSKEQDKRYRNIDNDPRGPWKPGGLDARNYYSEGIYSITTPSGRVIEGPPKGAYWRVSKRKLKELDDDGRIWWGKDGNNVPSIKRFLSEVTNGLVPQTLWSYDVVGHTQEAKKESVVLFGDDVFTTPKPERLIQRILHIGSDEGELVLDFFLGSGTSAAIAHKMGRQYIGIEQMDYIQTIPVERLKKVIAGEQGGISDAINWQGGGSFVFCELRQWNEQYVQKILNASDKATLQTLWAEMQTKADLSYRLELKQFNENAQVFAELSLDDMKRFLMEVLDKNQLYVNLSEIDDETYGVSEEDKRLNQLFYGINQ